MSFYLLGYLWSLTDLSLGYPNTTEKTAVGHLGEKILSLKQISMCALKANKALEIKRLFTQRKEQVKGNTTLVLCASLSTMNSKPNYLPKT